ncbi:unnamed protein product [Ilex paraguariensis]|uniref:Uncharacterized protein n=1 Tax=Ilex paraguariensis TaxID=185542 RepID=A0ABC8R5I2_9AQUA
MLTENRNKSGILVDTSVAFWLILLLNASLVQTEMVFVLILLVWNSDARLKKNAVFKMFKFSPLLALVLNPMVATIAAIYRPGMMTLSIGTQALRNPLQAVIWLKSLPERILAFQRA